MKQEDTKHLATKDYIAALKQTLGLAYRASPLAVWLQIVNMIIDTGLPFVTTILAAQTTTALAEAFAGVAGAREHALTLVVVTSLVGLLQVGWMSMNSYLQQMINYKISLAISVEMFRRFVSLDFWRYDDQATIDMYSKATNFSSSFPYIFGRITSLGGSVLSMIGGVAALLYINVWIGVMVAVALVPGACIEIVISRKRSRQWKENIVTRRQTSYIEWNLLQPSAITELRLYSLARHLLGLYTRLSDKDRRGRLLIEREFIGWGLASSAIGAIIEVGSLIWVVVAIAARQQPLGQFIYVQQMIARALGGATSFAGTLGDLNENLLVMKDYVDFMGLTTADRHTRQLPAMQQLSFQHVSFTYPSATVEVLHDISLDIAAGSHVAIVGENGAGKSTLIKLLLGLYRPTQGSVRLNDLDIHQYDIESWHKQLGVLSQDFIGYRVNTIAENIEYGNISTVSTPELLDTASERAEFSSVVAKLKKGYDTMADNWFLDDDETDAAMLSGGQWQRLALARSFYRDAPTIILDEPTSAIDALAEAKIFRRLLSRNNKQTVITISHRLTTVERADRIYVMDKGRIVEQGTHAELVAQHGHYYEIFKDQLHE